MIGLFQYRGGMQIEALEPEVRKKPYVSEYQPRPYPYENESCQVRTLRIAYKVLEIGFEMLFPLARVLLISAFGALRSILNTPPL